MTSVHFKHLIRIKPDIPVLVICMRRMMQPRSTLEQEPLQSTVLGATDKIADVDENLILVSSHLPSLPTILRIQWGLVSTDADMLKENLNQCTCYKVLCATSIAGE